MQTDQVNIMIKYLAGIREKTGVQEERVSFPSRSTLNDVADWVLNRYGLTVPNPRLMAILNGRGWGQYPEKLSTELKEGDTICLFPPISGG
jgi:molybdopterin converting factor small subunit